MLVRRAIKIWKRGGNVPRNSHEEHNELKAA